MDVGKSHEIAFDQYGNSDELSTSVSQELITTRFLMRGTI